MKAIVQERYGSPDALELREIKKPTPKDNEVLIKVHAASVNAYDWHLMRGEPFIARIYAGFPKPKNTILGADVAGRVESIGNHVKLFQIGDEVFGDLAGTGVCGFAEYVRAPETRLVKKTASLTFEEAAAMPMASVTALQGLRDKGQIRSGKKVLINGAGGGVGTFAVQIAKSYGTEVTAVCSTKNLDMAHSLGADHVIDYTKENFTRNGRQYDLILGANGFHSLSDYKRSLSPDGIYVMTGGTNAQIFQALLLGPLMSLNGNKKLINLEAKPNQKDLTFVKELFESGKVKPVIDRKYPLVKVPEAIRYLEEGHAKGKVVISVVNNN